MNIETTPDANNTETQMSMHPVYCSANVSVVGSDQQMRKSDRDDKSSINESGFSIIQPPADHCGLFIQSQQRVMSKGIRLEGKDLAL